MNHCETSFQTGKTAQRQFATKNGLLDQIANHLGLKADQSSRARICKTLDRFEKPKDQAGVTQVLDRLQKDGLTSWAQFSPWLNGDPEWKNFS